MKKIPKKKRKVTELYFNEYDGAAVIYTYNTKLKKRLTTYAATYPDLCQLTEDDGNGGLRFEIDSLFDSIASSLSANSLTALDAFFPRSS